MKWMISSIELGKKKKKNQQQQQQTKEYISLFSLAGIGCDMY